MCIYILLVLYLQAKFLDSELLGEKVCVYINIYTFCLLLENSH